ncbi:F390 synthetase-related protein [Paenibacillus sp. WLX1005]|uniref:F390 synthetase-related protein n=1 Tax=Paenibacillus sp. WLX1005 TaxID=3243766 RepID=UPI0039842D5F
MAEMSVLRIVYHYWQTRQRRKRWNSREALERWQEWQVQRHIQWVRAHSPFYRRLWNGMSDGEWRDFPLIDKRIMMEHFDLLNTIGITREQALDTAQQAEQTRDFAPVWNGVTIGLSSGTSGNRGIFLVSPQEQDAWTGNVLARLLPGSLRERHRIAFFLRANSNLYESVQRGSLQFRYFDLTLPMERHIADMQQYGADIWVAPPSLLRMLAQAAQDGKLTVQPSKLISVAEVLDPLDRQYIQQTFQQKVHQVYQCTEGFLGTSCEHGTIHLNEDVVHIEKEYIDDERRRFMPIITDFSRRAQPIVRYRLNDILTEAAEPCACGSVCTAIERIEGRYDDILYIRPLPQRHSDRQADGTGADEKYIPLFPDLVTRAIIAASPDIQHYRAIQHDVDRLEISYVLPQGMDGKVEQTIRQRIEQLCTGLGGQVPQLMFSEYDFVPGPVKLRRVERGWHI